MSSYRNQSRSLREREIEVRIRVRRASVSNAILSSPKLSRVNECPYTVYYALEHVPISFNYN